MFVTYDLPILLLPSSFFVTHAASRTWIARSHVSGATWLGFVVSAGYTMTLGMKKTEAAGVPPGGMYFNVAMMLFFAFINYQA